MVDESDLSEEYMRRLVELTKAVVESTKAGIQNAKQQLSEAADRIEESKRLLMRDRADSTPQD